MSLFENTVLEPPAAKDKRLRALRTVGSVARQKEDFYPTPPHCTYSLLERETFNGTIFEPACGDGAISKVLEDAGYSVTSRDLFDRGYGEPGHNFFDCKEKFPNIITNPPFVIGLRFVQHALTVTEKKVAMLLPITFLETETRAEFLKTSPLKSVYIFSKRVQFDTLKGGGGAMCFAWYVWETGWYGKPQIDWI